MSSRLNASLHYSIIPVPENGCYVTYKPLGLRQNHFFVTRSAELHSSTHDQLLRRAVLVDVIDRLLWVRGAAGPAWWISSSGSARRWQIDTEGGDKGYGCGFGRRGNAREGG